MLGAEVGGAVSPAPGNGKANKMSGREPKPVWDRS